MRCLTRFLTLLIALSFIAGCGGGGGGSSSGGGNTTTLTITGISPAFVYPGDTVTVAGTSLSSVTGVRVGTLDVGFTLVSETRLTFVVPDAAVSGTVTLLSGTASFPAPTALTVLGVPQVTAVTPASARPGDSLTLAGVNLANVSRVIVGGVSVIPTSRSGTEVVVVVPTGASNGTLALLMTNGSTRTVTQTFNLLPAVITVTSISPNSGPQGTVIRLTGTALDSATGATIGGVAASILAQTSTTLDLAAPNASGAIVLSISGGQSFNVGSFTLTTGTAPVVSISQVDVAQAMSQPSGGTRQLLVPGKAALLRAYVTANQAIASPAVTATISGCAALPSVTLSGPSSLPTTTPALDNLAGTFSAQIPASCVKTGLSVQITVANTAPVNSGATRTATPAVGKATNLKVLLVPLVTNGSTGTVPDTETVRRMFARAYPVDAANIQVTVRTPYTLTTTVVSGSAGGSWSSALAEVNALRNLEGNGKHYVGLVPSPGFSGGTSGLAYQNDPASGGSGFMSAIVLDAVALSPSHGFSANASLDTITHEVGHNMTLGHAPCGNPPDADTSFPYSGGGLGPYPVHEFDSDRNGTTGPETVYFPGASIAHDVMGYCDGEWFSDYYYAQVQTYMQTFAYPAVTPFAAPVEMLDFYGEIRDGKVRLQPPGARMSDQPYAGGGSHTLRVTTSANAVVDVPFAPIKVADEAGDVKHFHVFLKNPGEIAKVEVLSGTRSLPVTLDAPPVAAASVAGTTATTSAAQVSWSESGGKLTLTWDAARYPVLRVRHLGAEATVLALRLTGGSASLPLDNLPAGGQWEFSLSGGLNAKSVTVAR
ncbi:hypothetical protein GCM10025771_05190 [Niveibacterium umoris]|uniref:Cyclic nucleotide-binding domain-containing protein n=1 Tax=Niveibacterium umoris TaxID=1193620 RepID=A0A840BMR5_9RHOO|nr:M12 family metallo-peptidase [Niveibacterium umoris]MBB4013933.1 hypothetical protein [Niveibacterium umoris]